MNGEQQAAFTVQVRLLKLMPLYMQWIATVTGLQDQTADKINRPLFSLFCCPALWSRLDRQLGGLKGTGRLPTAVKLRVRIILEM